MSERNSLVEVFIRHAKSNGFILDAIPMKTGKIGNYYGLPTDGTEIDESDEKPKAITHENLPRLGDRPVVADGVTVRLKVMGEQQDTQIANLHFTKSTSHWPAQIVEQVPEIAEMVKLRSVVRAVQQNPRLKKLFVAWLKENQDARALLEAIHLKALI
jgi:predicted component of type VI protein secretion system